MKTRFLALLPILSLSLLPIHGMAQGMGGANTTVTTNPYAQVQTPWLVAGRVRNIHGEAIKGAAVTIAPTIAAQVRTLATDADGKFRTSYQLNASGVDEFNVVLTVKKKGYPPAHTYASFAHSAKTWEVPVTLPEPGDDPSQLSSDDLISGLLASLKLPGPSDGLAAKSQKDYARAVADYFDQHRQERAMPEFAKVLQLYPGCIGCRTMAALAELGWNDLEDSRRDLALSVNAVLGDKKNGRPEPLVAYGTWLNWQHDSEKAEPFFLEALKYNPKDTLALQELGRTLLAEQKFEYAADYLNKALTAGAGPEARLLYVQALVGAGRSGDALPEMNRYIGGRDVKKLPIHIRQVWTSVQNQQAVTAHYAQASASGGRDRVDFLHYPPAELIHGLQPANDQAQLVPILDGVGANIQEFLKNFSNTSSEEAIEQQKLDRKGKISGAQKQKFRYLCMAPRETWGPGLIEYRADSGGHLAMPKGLSDGFMLTQGFNSTALFFHPSYRTESKFQYLGRQSVDGRDAYVLAFAQIPEKAHLTGNFRKGQTSITTFSQGLAWIDSGTFQLVRIHTELLVPMPEVRLDRQSMDVRFREVHFAHLNRTAWLPDEVLVNLDWNGRQLRNQHDYSDYQAFDVDESQKIAQPKGDPDTPPLPGGRFTN